MTEVTSDAAETRLRRSPLHERHTALGAKFAPSGLADAAGKPGGGVLKEHTAVREGVGVFDVSHLGKIRVTGPGAAGFVNACLTNDLGRIAPGQAQYTLCCDEATGGVVDDIIAYLRRRPRLPDPERREQRRGGPPAARRRAAGVTVTDEHEAYAVLAVQGPRSADLLGALGLPTGHDYMSFSTATLDGWS
ncbi:hypothetical protein V2I01_02940 [Micromonospora sp. BRA006-A]|nr:hypothetical protein [Micromonospora sp. BRA006-A]